MQDQNLETQKNIAKNIKPLKIQHLFTNPKKYCSCNPYPKKYKNSKFQTQKSTPLIPVSKFTESTPWGLQPGTSDF